MTTWTFLESCKTCQEGRGDTKSSLRWREGSVCSALFLPNDVINSSSGFSGVSPSSATQSYLGRFPGPKLYQPPRIW